MIPDVLVAKLNTNADTDDMLRYTRWYMEKSGKWVCVAGVL